MKEQADTWVLPRLPSPPSMSDIHHLLSRALENRGQSFEICWTPMGGLHEYILSVEASPRGGDAHWRMFAGINQAKPLWTYSSCDVLLVYNLLVSSSGDMPYAGDVVESANRLAVLGNREGNREGLPGQSSDFAVHPTASFAEPPSNGRTTSALAGDLEHVQVPTLLQSILMAKMTGMLEIKSQKRKAQVFFVDGLPVHCLADNTVGEESVFELLTWKDGEFHFEPKKTTDARTIKQNLDSLLLQGMQLIDNAAYLRNLGLRPESHISPTHKSISEQDFEAMVGRGTTMNMESLKKFYRSLDPKLTVQQLLEQLRLPRSLWIQLMCNLFRAEMIAIEQPAASKRALKVTMEPKRIDKRLIQTVMMTLRSPDTGMFTYPAFLYFLEQEYFRAYRSANPISVIIFQMRINSPGLDPVSEPLPSEALGEAVRRISRVKRHVDLLAHYEQYDYALLLPNTKTVGAQVFANRIVKALQGQPLIPMMSESSLKIAFGIAAIPEDFCELSQLLSAAEVAKNTAVLSDAPVVMYRDIC